MPNITLYLTDDEYGKWLELDNDKREHMKSVLKTIINTQLNQQQKPTIHRDGNNGKAKM